MTVVFPPLFLPEIGLFLLLMGTLLTESLPGALKYRLHPVLSPIGCLLCGLGLFYGLPPSWEPPSPLFFGDGLTFFFKLFFLTLAFFTCLFLFQTQSIATEHSSFPLIPESRQAVFLVFILGSTLAACLLAAAANFLLIFLALLLLICLHSLLAAWDNTSLESIEAGLKYFCLGIAGFFMFFFGVGLLFFETHSFSWIQIQQFLTTHPLPSSQVSLIFLLCFSFFSFQLGLFPLAFSFPDLVQGAPTPLGSFLSLMNRGVGLLLTLRLFFLFVDPFSPPSSWEIFPWQVFFAACSGTTLVLGPLLAYQQTCIKRGIAYLMLSQSGFWLIGLLSPSPEGLTGLLFHSIIELFSILGIFYFLFLTAQAQKNPPSPSLGSLRGLLHQWPFESTCFILFLLALLGVPPLPSFFGKWILMGTLTHSPNAWLIFLAALSLIFSLASVARFLSVLMAIPQEKNTLVAPHSFPQKIALGLLTLPLVGATYNAEPLLNGIRTLLASLRLS